MKLTASTATEADTLGTWLTKMGHPYSRTGFIFTTPTPRDPKSWLESLRRSATLNGDRLTGVRLVGE